MEKIKKFKYKNFIVHMRSELQFIESEKDFCRINMIELFPIKHETKMNRSYEYTYDYGNGKAVIWFDGDKVWGDIKKFIKEFQVDN